MKTNLFKKNQQIIQLINDEKKITDNGRAASDPDDGESDPPIEN